MAKLLPPPPRKLSWLTRLLVFNSHVYSLGGWVATGMGCLIIWFGYTIGRPPAYDSPGIYDELVQLGALGRLAVIFLVGMVFLGVGLATLIYFTFKNGWREVWLLRYGEVAMGKGVENKKKSLGSKPNKNESNYLTFETKEGITHQVTSLVNSRNGYKLKDGAKKLILYAPENPDLVVVFDAIPNAPSVLPDGRFGPTPNPRASILLAPLLVLLLNIGFYAYHSGPSQGRDSKTLSEIYQQALRYRADGDDKETEKAFLAFIELLEDKPPSSLYFIDHDRARYAYGFLLSETKNREKRKSYLKNTIKHMALIDRVEPIDTAWQKSLASHYYDISRSALYGHFFAEAEQTARRALELDPAAHRYITPLPAALLFQGKYMEAQDIYLKWKDQLLPYEEEISLGSLFLRDLEQIEGTATSRMDVERAKAFLLQ